VPWQCPQTAAHVAEDARIEHDRDTQTTIASPQRKGRHMPDCRSVSAHDDQQHSSICLVQRLPDGRAPCVLAGITGALKCMYSQQPAHSRGACGYCSCCDLAQQLHTTSQRCHSCRTCFDASMIGCAANSRVVFQHKVLDAVSRQPEGLQHPVATSTLQQPQTQAMQAAIRYLPQCCASAAPLIHDALCRCM
jgi:hypothetical protein